MIEIINRKNQKQKIEKDILKTYKHSYNLFYVLINLNFMERAAINSRFSTIIKINREIT